MTSRTIDDPPDQREPKRGRARAGAKVADLAQARRQRGQRTARPPSQATQLVHLVEDAKAELLCSPTGLAYVTIPVPVSDRHLEHRETWPLRGKGFRTWLSRSYYRKHGTAPGSQALQNAIDVLAGNAEHGAPTMPVHVRVAGHNGAVYLDLGDPSWSVVQITADGWQLTREAPVRFWRPRGYGALPTPVPGGELTGLRRYLNLAEDDWPLVAGWLVGTLSPAGPYLILGLLGSQGSAKSTTARLLRELVDPNAVALRRPPRDDRSVAIAAASNRLVALDNLSHVPEWLSDVLCTLATGGGYATRELYSDADERLFEFPQQPVLLTSIEVVIVRGDLLDRSLLVYLPPLGSEQRRPEAGLWRQFRAEQPRLLGALLDAASMALRRLPEVQLDRLPRMADAARWITAAEPALGFPEGATFLALHEGNQAESNEIAVNASLVGRGVRHLVDLGVITAAGPWRGTARELLGLLNEHTPTEARGARKWPADPTRLAGKLRSIQPALAGVGIDVAFTRGTDRSRERRIAITYLEQVRNAASAAEANDGAEQVKPRRTLSDAVGR